ncbi:hypothetical protein LWI28_020775 [Acer negundo]|uniref:Uncharacterized protein n=1 Tax=Acer negundo TaxID=4023 RepID=A0AAD5NJE5_ACENE|nr:hypothetical protein LWI28_020775 [Acer negundo]
MASKNCWMAFLVFLVSMLLLMTSELAAARKQLGRTSKPVMNNICLDSAFSCKLASLDHFFEILCKGPANLVRDASCWQREHEWQQDIAVTKWLSGVSPFLQTRLQLLKKNSFRSSLKIQAMKTLSSLQCL